MRWLWMTSRVPDAPSSSRSSGRQCGACSLCCTVLRVDELGKLAGESCPHLLEGGGCGIYERRPAICRAYHCLWLSGGLDVEDRPDRLGAVVDLLSDGFGPRLGIQEAVPGAFDRSDRLRAIAERHRSSLPVRVVPPGKVLDPDRPFRVLLPGGEEQLVAGDRIEVHRPGRAVVVRRLPWLERFARRVLNRWRRARIDRARREAGRSGRGS